MNTVLTSAKITHIAMEATSGSNVGNTIRDAIKVAFETGKDVIVTHNSDTFTVNVADIVDYVGQA